MLTTPNVTPKSSAAGRRIALARCNSTPAIMPASAPNTAEPYCCTRAFEKNRVSPSPSITMKKTGVKKMPNSVTPNMPLKTAVPSARRISAPAPLATTSGTTPRIKAKLVIMIGRRRKRQASRVAWCSGCPSSRSCLANSTIKIAFLHASPTSTTSPICTKILIAMCAMATPRIDDSKHIGTTRITASGSDQLS